MTTNEIMANLEKMSNVMNDNIEALKIPLLMAGDPMQKKMLKHEIETITIIKAWLDDLQEKHWKEEDEYASATLLLHIND